MRELAPTKADLIVDDTLPGVLLDLLAHTETYHGVAAQWDNADYSEHWSVLAFPTAILGYAEANFTELKKRQGELLATRDRSHRGGR